MAVRIVRQHRRISVSSRTVSALFFLQAVAIYRIGREFDAISKPGLTTYNACLLPIAGDAAIGRSVVCLFLADARGDCGAVGVPLRRSGASASPSNFPDFSYAVSHFVNSPGVPSGYAFTSSRVPRINRTGFRPSTTMIPSGAAFFFFAPRTIAKPCLALTWQVVLLRASPPWGALAAFFIPCQSLLIDD
ncbi:hypothetical protein [Burkholderia stagnalis]|uniref:hypothetical protein n=1 Tax=Burkholderia stagnalis TaxID=1503054 RepID=UPI0012D97158|nr:hypothetical protein [Burkholderia stagnalis]